MFRLPHRAATSVQTMPISGTETHQCHVIKTTYVVGQKNKADPGMVLDGAECGDDKVGAFWGCKSPNKGVDLVVSFIAAYLDLREC